MYFDGQNLEAESAEEEKRLIDILKGLGAIDFKPQNNPPILKVSDYTFIVSEGGEGFTSITGLDDVSDEILEDLYVKCGGKPN